MIETSFFITWIHTDFEIQRGAVTDGEAQTDGGAEASPSLLALELYREIQ